MGRRLSIVWLVVWLAGLLAPGVRAQPPVQVEWERGNLSTPPSEADALTVGDQFTLRLKATYPAEGEIVLPALPREWGPFEVLDQRALPTVENQDGTRTAAREATVTLWTPGAHPTPDLDVRYRTADDKQTIAVPPLTVTVASVLTEDDVEKRDLKPQATLPRPFPWPWVLGGLSLIGLVGVWGWLWYTRWRRSPDAPAAPVIVDLRPPEEIAYHELDRIAAIDLPSQGDMKGHYTLIADCLRQYVQGRYHLPALDRTTWELMTMMRRASANRDLIDRGHTGLLRELLEEADLVKFAKVRPPVAQARDAVERARHFVTITTPAPPAETTPGNPSTTQTNALTQPSSDEPTVQDDKGTKDP